MIYCDCFKYVGWDPTATSLPMNLVRDRPQIINKRTWDEGTDVLKSLYNHLILKHSRIFFMWDSHLVSLLYRTHQYCGSTMAEDQALESQWKELMSQYLGLGEEMEAPVV